MPSSRPRPHRHYSPGLPRFLISALYHEAQVRRVPMTVLANDLLEQKLRGGEG